MRLYRRLLQFCAPSLHREYGAAMEETFARRLADARAVGIRRRVQVWRRELAGLVALAASERWSAAARERRRREKLALEWKAGRMEGIGQEIRLAARRLLRTPAFTSSAVLTLALAIGANASIFAVVQRVVLNPLPYPDSDRLIELDHGAQSLNLPNSMGSTAGLYFHYLDRARTLDGAALYRADDVTIVGDGPPERIRMSKATPSLVSVLRVSPVLGRWFSAHEGTPGAPQVAVLSHRLWVRRYGANPSIIGRPIILSGVQAEIIGVMPASFAFPAPQIDVWNAEQLAREQGFGFWNWDGVARLRDGATVDDARKELNGLIGDVVRAFPNDPLAQGNVETRLTFVGNTLKEATIGGITRALWILLASVGLVLLVACANVANLFLVRTEARQRDIAVRRALGAGGLSIARYFLTESLLLAAAGGAIGLLIAWGAARLVVGFGPPNLPRLEEIRLDGVVVAFTIGLSLVAALAFGVIPLWRGGGALASSLHESGRSNSASRRRHFARHVLMGSQIAVALVLLVSSGLMIRSFQKLRAVDAGFDPSSALTFSIGLPDREYPTREAALAAHRAILERVSALPGVVRASATTCLPLSGGCSGNTVLVEGRVNPPGTVPPLALFRAVAGGYFETMGTRLLRGRTIERGDVDRGELAVVVSESFAKRFFPNEDPIGRRVGSNRPPPGPGEPPAITWLTIVGVVADTPVRTLGAANPFPQIYLPMSIAGGPGMPRSALLGPDVSVMSYVVRTATPPSGLVPAVRRAIDGVDRTLALAQVGTLQNIVDRASAQMAFTMLLLAVAAAVALLLGLIGIYGVMSYIVSQRTGEIGVRLALGAAPGSVAGQIVRQGGLVAAVGITIGLGVAYAGSRLIESLLYGVSPRDPMIFGATTLILLAVALAACWVPARRAAQLNPVDALRAE